MEARAQKLQREIADLEERREVNLEVNAAMIAARIDAGGRGNQWDSDDAIIAAGVEAGVAAAPADQQALVRELRELHLEVRPTPPTLPTFATAIRRRRKKLAKLGASE